MRKRHLFFVRVRGVITIVRCEGWVKMDYLEERAALRRMYPGERVTVQVNVPGAKPLF